MCLVWFCSSVDLRARPLEQAKHWKNERLAARAQFDTSTASTAAFMLSNVSEDDDGIYRCRVDFRHTPTRHVRYQLNVVRKFKVFFSFFLSLTFVTLWLTSSMVFASTVTLFTQTRVRSSTHTHRLRWSLPRIVWETLNSVVKVAISKLRCLSPPFYRASSLTIHLKLGKEL